MKSACKVLLALVISGLLLSCGNSDKRETQSETDESGMVVKRRDDGTVSSVNPVDDDGYVHGVKTNYYEDGRTVHSKVTYNHGRKHGPALWYYKNGQVHEHTNFTMNHKDGLTRRYYEDGKLMEELTYQKGEEVPGSSKKYKQNGELIND